MSGHSTRRGRREKFTITLPAATAWSTPQQVAQLGESGRLSRAVIRAPSGASGDVDIMVYCGAGYDDTTDPSTVVHEDRVYYRTTITLTGADPLADDDYNLLANVDGGGYDIRRSTDDMWVSIQKTSGAGVSGVVVSLEAIDSL